MALSTTTIATVATVVNETATTGATCECQQSTYINNSAYEMHITCEFCGRTWWLPALNGYTLSEEL